MTAAATARRVAAQGGRVLSADSASVLTCDITNAAGERPASRARCLIVAGLSRGRVEGRRVRACGPCAQRSCSPESVATMCVSRGEAS